MPNWIEGSMRIRGKSKNVYRFIKEAFKEIRISEYEDYDAEISITEDAWLIGSNRAFSLGSEVYIEDVTTEKETTISIGMRQAWGWFSEEFYKDLSDKYDVDIRCIGWERGMQYKGEMTVLRGQSPMYKETKYDNWYWEAECPELGG